MRAHVRYRPHERSGYVPDRKPWGSAFCTHTPSVAHKGEALPPALWCRESTIEMRRQILFPTVDQAGPLRAPLVPNVCRG